MPPSFQVTVYKAFSYFFRFGLIYGQRRSKKIKEVSVSISEIATASNEQATGIEQINQAVVHMSGVVQGTAAIAEESASSSTEMSSQAARINDTIDELIHMVYGSEIKDRNKNTHSLLTDDHEVELTDN